MNQQAEILNPKVRDYVNTLVELQKDYSLILQASTEKESDLQEAEQTIEKRENLFKATAIRTITQTFIRNNKLDDLQTKSLNWHLEFALVPFYRQTDDYSHRANTLGNLAARSGFFSAFKKVAVTFNSNAQTNPKLTEAAVELEKAINNVIRLFGDQNQNVNIPERPTVTTVTATNTESSKTKSAVYGM